MIVTDRGKPAYVLMAYVEYKATHGASDDRPLSERLAMAEDLPGESDAAFDSFDQVMQSVYEQSRSDFGRMAEL